MAALTYESAEIWYDSDASRPQFIDVEMARSLALKDLDGSVAVRNNVNVAVIPQQVRADLDPFCLFLEARDFEAMKATAERYLLKRQMKQALGATALNADNTDRQQPEPFPVPAVTHNAVTAQLLSMVSHERYFVVDSLHVRDLDQVDLSAGMPADPIEADRVVLRLMAAAVEEIESGIPLAESEAAQALGYQAPSPVYS